MSLWSTDPNTIIKVGKNRKVCKKSQEINLMFILFYSSRNIINGKYVKLICSYKDLQAEVSYLHIKNNVS